MIAAVTSRMFTTYSVAEVTAIFASTISALFPFREVRIQPASAPTKPKTPMLKIARIAGPVRQTIATIAMAVT